jgi:hypothetical protein
MTIEKEITSKINISQLTELPTVDWNGDFFLLNNGKKIRASKIRTQVLNTMNNPTAKIDLFNTVVNVNWGSKTIATNGYTVPKHGVIVCQSVGNPCNVLIDGKQITKWIDQWDDCLMGPFPVTTGNKFTWTGTMNFAYFFPYVGN